MSQTAAPLAAAVVGAVAVVRAAAAAATAGAAAAEQKNEDQDDPDAAIVIPTEHDISLSPRKKGFLSPLPPCVAGRADADLSFSLWCGRRRRSLRLRYTMPLRAEG